MNHNYYYLFNVKCTSFNRILSSVPEIWDVYGYHFESPVASTGSWLLYKLAAVSRLVNDNIAYDNFPLISVLVFFIFELRDWLASTCPKWPILCQVGHKTLLHFHFHHACWNWAHFEFADYQMWCMHRRQLAHALCFLVAATAYTRYYQISFFKFMGYPFLISEKINPILCSQNLFMGSYKCQIHFIVENGFSWFQNVACLHFYGVVC